MPTLKWSTLATLALLTVVGLTAPALGQQQLTTSGALTAGSTYCFPVENLNANPPIIVQPQDFIGVSGSASNANNGNPVNVIWSIWAGPTTNTTTYTRFFHLTGPNPVVGSSILFATVHVGLASGDIPPGDFAQACINNDTTHPVNFTITEEWE